MAIKNKRAASSQKGGARKKPASHAQAAKCHAIASAVKEAKGLGLQELPATLVDMLASMTSSSIGVYKDTRQPQQAQVVEMIGKALKAIGAAKEAKVAELKKKVDGKDADKAARDKAARDADVTLAGLKDTLSKKKEDAATANTAKAAAAAALKDAKKVQKSGDAKYEAVGAEKAQIEDGLNSLDACPLDKKGVSSLVHTAKEYKIDGSLIESMHTALTKTAEARGTFDNVIMTQLKDAITGLVTTKNEELKAGQPGKDERAAAVATASDAFTAAEAHEKGCKDAVTEAEKSAHDGAAASRATAKALGQFLPDLKHAMDNYDEAKGALKAFQEGPLAAYTELKALETPPPPPEPEPVEEPVAAEEGAADAGATA